MKSLLDPHESEVKPHLPYRSGWNISKSNVKLQHSVYSDYLYHTKYSQFFWWCQKVRMYVIVIMKELLEMIFSSFRSEESYCYVLRFCYVEIGYLDKHFKERKKNCRRKWNPQKYYLKLAIMTAHYINLRANS